MENFNLEKYLNADYKSFKDYTLLIRNNLKYLIIISSIIIAAVILYAFLSKDIYTSTATVKITEQNKNVLENIIVPFGSGNSDRFITNEIRTITDFRVIEKVSLALIDSFNNTTNKNLFYLTKSENNINAHKEKEELIGLVGNAISVEQISGTDIVQISADSPSPLEAAIIVNTCAHEYQKLNLEMNRAKLSDIRIFLEKQGEQRLAELQDAEDSLMKFQEKSKIVALDVQSTGIITQLSQLDAQKEMTKMELMTSDEVLKQYKFFLNNKDPQLVNYLESQTSQAYITALQQQLAELQVNRDLTLSIKSPNLDITGKVKEYDQRIEELKQKLNSTINNINVEAYSANPDQVKDLAQKLIEEEIKNNTLSVKLNQLEAISQKYSGDLKRLPKTSVELAQLQRKRETLQQIYLLITERYQEAMINELSQSGNVTILSEGGIPGKPSKPNRSLIIIFGIVIGLSIAVSLIIIKEHFNDKVKSPDDIQKNNISFLSWIPQLSTNGQGANGKSEMITIYEQESPVSESFRAIRARIQFSNINSHPPKIILVTSPAEQEGKTFVSINLAGSYTQADKKTLLIDCDLRRPRIHSIMGADKKPGLSDYLIGKARLDEIIRKTRTNNLNYIASGSIPSNTAELLGSQMMKDFLKEIRDIFDVIIIDSAPIIAVIDAEILARQADGTLLVISAEKTDNRLLKDAVDLLKSDKTKFLGTVLNNFKYKSGYGYYYKYYYNYSDNSNQRGRKKIRVKS